MSSVKQSRQPKLYELILSIPMLLGLWLLWRLGIFWAARKIRSSFQGLKRGIIVLWETLKKGKKGAGQQYRYMILAFRTAPLWFKIFLVTILAAMVVFFIILGEMVNDLREGRPVSLSFQQKMLFLAQIIPWFYSLVANAILMYHERHKGQSEHAEVSPRQWLRFFLGFWGMTIAGVVGAYLYTLLYNLIASKFTSLGLWAAVPCTAAAQAVYIFYWQIAAYINAWTSRRRHPEQEEEKEAMPRITRAERREYRRMAAPYMHPVWRWTVLGIMLAVIPSLLVLDKGFRSSSKHLTSLFIFLMLVILNEGNKLWAEHLTGEPQRRGAQGERCALPWHFVWRNTLTHELQILTLVETIVIAVSANGFITVVVDVLLHNPYPQVHTALAMVIGILLAPFIGSLMNKAPADADQAAAQAKADLLRASGPTR